MGSNPNTCQSLMWNYSSQDLGGISSRIDNSVAISATEEKKNIYMHETLKYDSLHETLGGNEGVFSKCDREKWLIHIVKIFKVALIHWQFWQS